MTDTVARTNRERMGRTELLEEVEWLLDAGVHPLLIADVMHRTAESIDVAARRLGNARVAAAFREGVGGDETHSYGRGIGRDDMTVFVRDGEVDIPKHMISERIRAEVEEVWDELIELLGLIVQAFVDGPRELVPASPDSGLADTEEKNND